MRRLEGVYRSDCDRFIITVSANQVERFHSLTLAALACLTAPIRLQFTANIHIAPWRSLSIWLRPFCNYGVSQSSQRVSQPRTSRTGVLNCSRLSPICYGWPCCILENINLIATICNYGVSRPRRIVDYFPCTGKLKQNGMPQLTCVETWLCVFF